MSDVFWDPAHAAGYELEKYQELKARGKSIHQIAAIIRENGIKLGKGDLNWSLTFAILAFHLRYPIKDAKEVVLQEFCIANSIDEQERRIAKELEKLNE